MTHRRTKKNDPPTREERKERLTAAVIGTTRQAIKTFYLKRGTEQTEAGPLPVFYIMRNQHGDGPDTVEDTLRPGDDVQSRLRSLATAEYQRLTQQQRQAAVV